jgi:hypothetical protein
MAESPKTSLSWLRWQTTLIAILSLVCIATYLTLRFTGLSAHPWPLWIALLVGGLPLVAGLVAKVIKLEFGADLLGGISIVVSILLGEYLAGAIIVLMLSGGEALETYAMSNATSVLSALAKRLPTMAHRRGTDASAEIQTVPLEQIAVGDVLVIYPHEVAPVDGRVIEGHSVMDESYLTGEPFLITKTVDPPLSLERSMATECSCLRPLTKLLILDTPGSWQSCRSPNRPVRRCDDLGIKSERGLHPWPLALHCSHGGYQANRLDSYPSWLSQLPAPCSWRSRLRS